MGTIDEKSRACIRTAAVDGFAADSVTRPNTMANATRALRVQKWKLTRGPRVAVAAPEVAAAILEDDLVAVAISSDSISQKTRMRRALPTTGTETFDIWRLLMEQTQTGSGKRTRQRRLEVCATAYSWQGSVTTAEALRHRQATTRRRHRRATT